MDKLTLGAQLKQMYPGSYDDIPDDQLGELAVHKFARDADASPDDELESPGKVWEFLTNPLISELDRESFMPHEESGPAGDLMRFGGEVAYQFYRGIVRPSTSACPIRGKTGATRALCQGRRSYRTPHTCVSGDDLE